MVTQISIAPKHRPVGILQMELAIVTGRDPHKITHIAGKYPLLKEENVVVYGIRVWD
jgi:hypothetical protein